MADVEFTPTNSQGQQISTIRVNGFNGIRGVGQGVLIASAKVTREALPASGTRLKGLSVEMQVMGPGGAWLVGRMLPQFPAIDLDLSKDSGAPHEIQLEIPLRYDQLERIEEFRDGKDFYFPVRLSLLVTSGARAESLYTSQVQLVFNQSEWTALLNALGYGRTLLIEIPDPLEADAPGFAAAVSHLHNARDLLFRGKARDAVDACGSALEALARDSVKDYAELGTIRKDDANDKNTRIQYLRYALWHLASLARHAGGLSERTEWSREDAVAAIALTAALLKWCARRAIESER
jgi:hypothetical protein